MGLLFFCFSLADDLGGRDVASVLACSLLAWLFVCLERACFVYMAAMNDDNLMTIRMLLLGTLEGALIRLLRWVRVRMGLGVDTNLLSALSWGLKNAVMNCLRWCKLTKP